MSESSGGGARTCCLIKTWLFNTKPSETINCYQCWWRCVTRSLPRPSMVRTDQCPPLCRYCVDTLCRYCVDILTTLATIHSHAPLASWTQLGFDRPAATISLHYTRQVSYRHTVSQQIVMVPTLHHITSSSHLRIT